MSSDKTPSHKIISLEDISVKPEWAKIARAYEEAIVPFAPYQDLVNNLIVKVKNRKKIIDLGCGTGFPLRKLLEENPQREVIGVDSNISMLNIALEELIKQHAGKNFRLYHDDATNFNAEKDFDTVISSNVLFNLEKPMDYLDNAYNLLLPKCILVISSPFGPADMEARQKEMVEQYKNEGIYKTKKEFIETVWSVNKNFNRFNIYSTERMKEILLEFIGFNNIISTQTVYYQNFLIVAQKGQPRDVRFTITNNPQFLKQGFRLRYHWLHDRYNWIPINKQRSYHDKEDNDNLGCFAIEEGTDNLIGFLNYVPPANDLPFTNKTLLTKLKKQYKHIGAFNGYYVVNTKQKKGIGSFILASMLKWLKQQGLEAVVTDAYVPVVIFAQKMGGKVIGEEFKWLGYEGARGVPMLYDLTDKKTINIASREIEKYEQYHGRPAFTQLIF